MERVVSDDLPEDDKKRAARGRTLEKGMSGKGSTPRPCSGDSPDDCVH